MAAVLSGWRWVGKSNIRVKPFETTKKPSMMRKLDISFVTSKNMLTYLAVPGPGVAVCVWAPALSPRGADRAAAHNGL